MSLLDDIDDFYNTPLGLRVKRAIQETTGINNYLSVDGDTLIIGYGVPYLPEKYQPSKKSNIFCCSLSAVGAFYWPSQENNQNAHCDSNFLPFADQSFERVILVHGLEHAYHADTLLKEVWRILKGNGKMLLYVPNRRSVWSRREKIPFAQGHPYSLSQISTTLKENKYTVETINYSLRFLPISRFLPLKWVLNCEKWGQKIHLPFGGVLVVECGKRLYTPSGKKDLATALKIRSLKLGSISSS